MTVMGDIQKGDCAKCGAGPLGNCGFHGCETPRNTCPLRPHLSTPALPETQVGEGEGMIDQLRRAIAPNGPDGHISGCVNGLTYGFLNQVVASHEAQAAKIKALEEGLQRVVEISGDRAAPGFNEAGRLARINEIARALIEGAPS